MNGFLQDKEVAFLRKRVYIIQIQRKFATTPGYHDG